MTEAGTTVGYYFEGDAALPFSIAHSEADIASLAGDRKLRLSEWLEDRVVMNGKVEANVTIDGPVYISEGAVIHSGAEISGPVFVGRNCSVRHGAQIRAGTMLGDECVVGHSAEIKNSVCMSGSKMQSGVFVGDSVLGLAARIGSGCVLANRRFSQDRVPLGSGPIRTVVDTQFFGAVLGDYTRLGANVVTAPGTLVGPYTWVASLVSLHGFVPRAKLVMLKQDLELRDKEELRLRSGRGEYESA